mmetsp:Transcript_22304/g.45268  ORF Transcript_22304/g.45268 Transcript_22304/m.45268 type:complete len:95 (-) Transcript_22304:204-488(-)
MESGERRPDNAEKDGVWEHQRNAPQRDATHVHSCDGADTIPGAVRKTKRTARKGTAIGSTVEHRKANAIQFNSMHGRQTVNFRDRMASHCIECW